MPMSREDVLHLPVRYILNQAPFHLKVSISPLQNDLVLLGPAMLLQTDEAEVVVSVQPVPEKGAQVVHGSVTIDHAVKLCVDDKDDGTPHDIVMTEPFVDRFAICPLDWLTDLPWEVLALFSPDFVLYLLAFFDLHFFLNDKLDGF